MSPGRLPAMKAARLATMPAPRAAATQVGTARARYSPMASSTVPITSPSVPRTKGRVAPAEASSRVSRATIWSRSAAEERTRIARELHDILAHTLSTMVLQAGASRQVLRSDPKTVEELLLCIERTGREALGEVRRLLDLLR